MKPLLELPNALKIVVSLAGSAQRDRELIPDRRRGGRANSGQRGGPEIEGFEPLIVRPKHRFGQCVPHDRSWRAVEIPHEVDLDFGFLTGPPHRNECDDLAALTHDADGRSANECRIEPAE